jgi:energy-coupling factor transporter ATP-binding protein EcfA2
MNIPLPKGYEFVDLSNETYSYTLNKILWSSDNLNIIGCAGSGKSTLLKLACKLLKQKGENVVLLSSTGIAAVNIASPDSPAVTLHSFFKIKPLDVNPIESITTVGNLYPVINKVDVFIIDETSMVSAALFDYVIELVKAYKDHNMSRMPRFILFSDILQLAPVISNDKEVQEYYKYSYQGNVFFFNSVAFQDLGFKTIQLNYIFRQKDSFFQEILNRIRIGAQTNEDLAILNGFYCKEMDFAEKHDIYMNIFNINKSVNDLNESYLRTFTTKGETYYSFVSGRFDMSRAASLQDRVSIKEGMQILCLKNNWSNGYQNGSIGQVDKVFKDNFNATLDNGNEVTVVREKWEQYSYNKDEKGNIQPAVTGTFEQIGAKPCAALTTHRSQGQTFNSLYYDAGKFTPEAIVYVALSRLRTIEGLGLKRPLKHSDIKVSKEVLDFLDKV